MTLHVKDYGSTFDQRNLALIPIVGNITERGGESVIYIYIYKLETFLVILILFRLLFNVLLMT
jgi:hypothetical protein